MRIGAGFAFRAEPSEVEQTQAAANMAFRTEGSQFTESSVVVFTGWETGFLSNMLVQTVIAVGAVSGSREGLAFGHASKVVFMQILAFRSFLAKPLEEVLADQ